MSEEEKMRIARQKHCASSRKGHHFDDDGVCLNCGLIVYPQDTKPRNWLELLGYALAVLVFAGGAALFVALVWFVVRVLFLNSQCSS